MNKGWMVAYALVLMILAVLARNFLLPDVLNNPIIDGSNGAPSNAVPKEIIKEENPNTTPIVNEPIIEKIHYTRFSIISELPGGHSYASAAIDFNKDNYTDFIVGNYQQQNYLYINNGDHTFQQTPMFGTKRNTRSIVVADFDNDGASDVAVGNYNQQNAVYFNNDDGTFTESFLSGNDATMAISAIDLDSDGNIDIIEGTEEQGIYVYKNLGNGQFDKRQITSEKMHVRSLTECNLNSERIDIIVGTDFQINHILKNEGDLKFTFVPDFGEKQHTTSIACADFDKDGKNDVAVVGKSQLGKDLTKNYMYINEGNYKFKQYPAFGNAFSSTVLTADFNNDGKIDVMVGNYEGQSHVYENLGDLKWKELPAFSAEQTKISGMTPTAGKDYILSATAGDWNNDGFPDLIVTRDVEKSIVYLND